MIYRALLVSCVDAPLMLPASQWRSIKALEAFFTATYIFEKCFILVDKILFITWQLNNDSNRLNMFL